MPGPISDSYDPEFGTGEAAAEVREAVLALRDGLLTKAIGSEVRSPILSIIRSEKVWDTCHFQCSERTLRILRFAVDRALESL